MWKKKIMVTDKDEEERERAISGLSIKFYLLCLF